MVASLRLLPHHPPGSGAAHESFHFALATGLYKDNRIPPKGFDVSAAAQRLSVPVWHGVEDPGYFTADMRNEGPAPGEGQIWRFDLAKSFRDNAPGDEVILQFAGLDGLPADYQAQLVDRERGQAIDLQQQPHYSFFCGRRDYVRDEADSRFVLLVGDAEFMAFPYRPVPENTNRRKSSAPPGDSRVSCSSLAESV